MIVTTVLGRYRVEEAARGWFEFTLLAGHPPPFAVWVPPGFTTVHQELAPAGRGPRAVLRRRRRAARGLRLQPHHGPRAVTLTWSVLVACAACLLAGVLLLWGGPRD